MANVTISLLKTAYGPNSKRQPSPPNQTPPSVAPLSGIIRGGDDCRTGSARMVCSRCTLHSVLPISAYSASPW
jgi:hypothetical protein